MTRHGPIALLRVELGAVAATFLVFALLHLGVSIGPLSGVISTFASKPFGAS
jgi:hypothetical protein